MNHFLNWVKKEWFAVQLFGHLWIRCFFHGHLCIRSGRAFQCESLDGSLWEKKGEKEEEGELEHHWPHSRSCQITFTFSATFSIEPDYFHFRSKVAFCPAETTFTSVAESVRPKYSIFTLMNRISSLVSQQRKTEKCFWSVHPPPVLKCFIWHFAICHSYCQISHFAFSASFIYTWVLLKIVPPKLGTTSPSEEPWR